MQFQRLRLSGFKSFVEPTEFRIEPGLTGVVGPNGCGKSNLLEALRWVMGANSAKAMRAGGMDEVIFAGAGTRVPRNHAEVTLTIDNSDRTAPAQFNDHQTIEVVRRIDRGAGSTYRVNSREVRARDVQLLFADASTGANSPALVRQGQISELIAAKPQNRRRILEEAAGVSGLHTRRHEAELRLRAAETNLSRLDDVTNELETALNRLKREARQAEKYKRLSGEIRALQGAVLFSRWTEARDVLVRVDGESQEAGRTVEITTREASMAAAQALTAEQAIAPLREEEQVAAAVLHRLAIEKDRAERDAAQAAEAVRRLSDDLRRLDEDRDREIQIVDDAKAALSKIELERGDLAARIAAAPERMPQLQAAADAAERARAAAETEVEQLAARAAGEQAARRAALARAEEARTRLVRAERALEAAKADRANLGPDAAPEAEAAKARFEAALEALRLARAAVEAAETERAEAATAEAATREAARKLEDQLGRLKTEARGLTQLTAQPRKGGFAPALDDVSPDRGFEAALAAALGDDLDASLDRKAPSFWGGRDTDGPIWPEGATPLAPLIKAPPALAARLAFTAVVSREDGERLQGTLPIGARLVSKEGDLWRWDGFVARADAPKPAAVRLEQRTRLYEAEAEITKLSPAAAEASLAHQTASQRVRTADETLRNARRAPPEAERALGTARDRVEQLARETVRRDSRAQALNETLIRLQAEYDEAKAFAAQAEADLAAIPAGDDLAPQLAAAREASTRAREAAGAARSALDNEGRERAGRARRMEALDRDRADWTRRAASTDSRLNALAKDRAEVEAALIEARTAPEALEERKLKLLDEYSVAEARRDRAGEAMAHADNLRIQADREQRASEQRASEARELRASLSARLDAARERLAEMAQTIRDTIRIEPDELGRRIAEEATAVPADASGIEAHLMALERERDQIGAVNLRAEEESVEYATRLDAMRSERADLTGAIGRLRDGIESLNAEGRERLLAAFEVINGHFQTLFQALFGGGQAELRLIESDDPLEAGLEIFACPPGKRLSTMSLMSGGEQALTAAALIFGVFLANPAPICVLDEVDAPLDDANVDRFCNMLAEMRQRTQTRFIAITHNPVTMSRMDRLFGVTMPEQGVSQLVSVDLKQAEAMVAQ